MTVCQPRKGGITETGEQGTFTLTFLVIAPVLRCYDSSEVADRKKWMHSPFHRIQVRPFAGKSDAKACGNPSFARLTVAKTGLEKGLMISRALTD